MNTEIVVSIIICTCNRAADLRHTLSSLAGVCIPEGITTELVVVDNASTDGTAEVVKSCPLPSMRVRYVYEPRRGKGYAYNTGMAEAQGRIFLFTDDDVRPPKNWIAAMCDRILSGQADAVAGGVLIPEHLRALTELYPWWFASTETNSQEPSVRMVGANMAFGCHVLQRVPAFDVELGPGALGFHDETLFSRQLVNAGYQIGTAWDVEVQHHFDASRVTRKGYLSIAERIGRSDAYLHYHWLHINHHWSRWHQARVRFGLQARRALSWRSCFLQREVLEWEISRVISNAYIDQYNKERKRPRNYDERGLRKLAGAL